MALTICETYPFRAIYLSHSLFHTSVLLRRHPAALVAMPASAHWKEINEWKFPPRVSARADFLHPLRATAVIQKTDCKSILVGSHVFYFSKDLEVEGVEKVEPLEPFS